VELCLSRIPCLAIVDVKYFSRVCRIEQPQFCLGDTLVTFTTEKRSWVSVGAPTFDPHDHFNYKD
jgi:hypothetical protein